MIPAHLLERAKRVKKAQSAINTLGNLVNGGDPPSPGPDAEDTHECDFCFEVDEDVIKAGPYWCHEWCLIKAVEEGRR